MSWFNILRSSLEFLIIIAVTIAIYKLSVLQEAQNDENGA